MMEIRIIPSSLLVMNPRVIQNSVNYPPDYHVELQNASYKRVSFSSIRVLLCSIMCILICAVLVK